MTTEEIKAKIAKKERQISALKLQLTGATLRDLGQAISEYVERQPQSKQFPSGGYHAPKEPETGKIDDRERVINPVKPKPFPTTILTLEKNYDCLHNWTKSMFEDLSKRIAALENKNPSTAQFYTNSTGGLTSKM